MGRRKFRLGRLPKNYDRKGGGGKKTIGRPRKLASNISSAPSCVPGDKSPDGILQSEDSTSTIQSSKSLSLTGRLTNTFTSPDSSSSSSTVHGSKSQSVPEGQDNLLAFPQTLLLHFPFLVIYSHMMIPQLLTPPTPTILLIHLFHLLLYTVMDHDH